MTATNEPAPAAVSAAVAPPTQAADEIRAQLLHAIDPAHAVIEPLEAPPGAPLAPGVTRWDGVDFRPDVAHAARFWPHHHDTGGFFVARLRVL